MTAISPTKTRLSEINHFYENCSYLIGGEECLRRRFADRVFVLGAGQVLADGDSACIDSSILRRAYGLEARCERAANGDRVILADHCA